MKLLQNLIKHVSGYDDLREELNDLKEKIFKDREEYNTFPFFSWRTGLSWNSQSLEERIEKLENKLDLLLKHFDLIMTKQPASEEKIVIKSLRNSEPKEITKKRGPGRPRKAK